MKGASKRRETGRRTADIIFSPPPGDLFRMVHGETVHRKVHNEEFSGNCCQVLLCSPHGWCILHEITLVRARGPSSAPNRHVTSEATWTKWLVWASVRSSLRLCGSRLLPSYCAVVSSSSRPRGPLSLNQGLPSMLVLVIPSTDPLPNRRRRCGSSGRSGLSVVFGVGLAILG